MAFETVEPGVFCCVHALAEDECSITKNGKISVHSSALELVGIEHYCVLMADPDNLRLALRPVRDGEQQLSMAVVRAGVRSQPLGAQAPRGGDRR